MSAACVKCKNGFFKPKKVPGYKKHQLSAVGWCSYHCCSTLQNAKCTSFIDKE